MAKVLPAFIPLGARIRNPESRSRYQNRSRSEHFRPLAVAAANGLWVSGVRDTGKRAKVALKTFFEASNNSCAYKLPPESRSHHSGSHKASKQNKTGNQRQKNQIGKNFLKRPSNCNQSGVTGTRIALFSGVCKLKTIFY